MSETVEHRGNPQTEPTAGAKKLPRAVKALWHILGVAFWAYAIIKLFIFDFDSHLLAAYWPGAAWLLDYRFLFVLALTAILVLILGTGRFFLLALFIVGYPLILVFWTLPALIFKRQSWNVALAVLATTISFFQSLRYNLVACSLWLSSFVVALVSSERRLLYAASTLLLILLVATYIRTFVAVFRPTNLFRLYIKIFSVTRERVTAASTADKSIRNLPVASLNEMQLKKWTDDLGAVVLANRACLFAAKKLKEYQRSGFSVIFGVLTALALVIATTITFSAINFALLKADPTQFETTSASFFSVFYYSFNNLLFNSIKEIAPAKSLAQSISMIQNFFALFLIAMFVSLLISVRSERYAEEIDNVARTVESEGREIEIYIRKEFHLDSIEQAMAELERLQAGLIKILLWLTNNLRQ